MIGIFSPPSHSNLFPMLLEGACVKKYGSLPKEIYKHFLEGVSHLFVEL